MEQNENIKSLSRAELKAFIAKIAAKDGDGPSPKEICQAAHAGECGSCDEQGHFTKCS